MANSLLERLDERDRALFDRWVLQRPDALLIRRLWLALTHLGSAWCSIALATLPLVAPGVLDDVGALPLLALIISHLVIQGVKRCVVRPRPRCGEDDLVLIAAPDRFSFPSGHSAAAMSVALGFAFAYPEVSAVLVMLATLVGLSRVALGVHYPGDVFAGQVIAFLTAIAVVAVS